MSSPIRKPIARPSNGLPFDALAGTNHGNSSRSTSQASERRIPVKVDLRDNGSKKKSSNTATAQWFMTKTKRRGGGKRKKGKTQKKRKSTKKKK